MVGSVGWIALQQPSLMNYAHTHMKQPLCAAVHVEDSSVAIFGIPLQLHAYPMEEMNIFRGKNGFTKAISQ